MQISELLKPESTRKIKILLVDECPIILQGLAEILTLIQGVKIIGEAATVENALRKATDSKPDVIILDPSFEARAPLFSLRASGVPEIDICQRLRSLTGPLQIVAYTAFNTTADLMSLKLACVDGYIHKSTTTEQLVRTFNNYISHGVLSWNLCLGFEETRKRLLAASKVERLSPMEKKF